MSRVSIFIILVTGLHTVAGCGTEKEIATEPEERAPSYDFQIEHPIEIIDSLTHALEFVVPIQNTGQTPVKFDRIMCGCSCTNSRFDKDSLQPGETGAMHFRFFPSLRTGEQLLRCQWLDDQKKLWSASVKVELVRSNQFMDNTLSLGVAKPGEILKGQTRFRQYAKSVAQLPPKWVWKTSTNDLVVHEIDSQIHDTHRGMVYRETTLGVTWQVPTVASTYSAHISAEDKNSALPPSLAVECKVDQGISMWPSHLFILGHQETKIWTVKLKTDAKDNKRFRITNVSADKSILSFDYQKESSAEHEITIRLDPQAPKQNVDGKIRVQMEDSASKELVLPYFVVFLSQAD